MPELQGEPEDISKEKARLAAIQVHSLLHFRHSIKSHSSDESKQKRVVILSFYLFECLTDLELPGLINGRLTGRFLWKIHASALML